jgi:2-methylcitrate dehydratase PrpD
MSTSPPYVDALARFASRTRFEDLPDRVVTRAKHALVDTLAVIAAGMRMPELRALAAKQLDGAASGHAWLVGAGVRANPLDAAMLNGTAGAFLDFDEGNTRAHGHPGIQVLPAALAVAQTRGASGRDFLTAFLVGYEIGGRIGAASQMRLIVNPHGTFGVTGAAVAVARLTGLAPDRYRELINIAGSTAIAANRNTMKNGATVRNWYAGHSGFMGQQAVRLVEAGFTGPLDGPGTTFGMVLGEAFDPAVALEGLGRDWLIESSYLKLHPTARYAHSAIDALLDALPDHPAQWPRADDIERIDVRAYRLAAFLAAKDITHWFGTRFSVPFALATIVHHRRSGLDCFDERAIRVPAIRTLTERVQLSEDDAFTAEYPRRQRVELRVVLRDGRVLEGRCEITSGEPERPHPPGALEAKYDALAVPIWGERGARALYEQCMTLDRVANLRDFPHGLEP